MWDGKDFCFSHVEDNTQGEGASCWKVSIKREWSWYGRKEKSVVKIGMCSTFQAITIVTMIMMSMADLCLGSKFFIDRPEDAVNY